MVVWASCHPPRNSGQYGFALACESGNQEGPMIIAGLFILLIALYVGMLAVMTLGLVALGVGAALAVGAGICLGIAFLLAVEGAALLAWRAWRRYKGRPVPSWCKAAGVGMAAVGGVWFVVSCALLILLVTQMVGLFVWNQPI
ncbi:hypothetical protein CS006_06490 [Bifidobacterium primatium]|uniref:Uncharacterized protein n=2 Tax=Bifidobacterium primatium TaxID=2045438 RepID=A0A2M9H7Y5_9BIFI|nr:hypothetical protein CS006_06490 [Bifidobacterium primatium]